MSKDIEFGGIRLSVPEGWDDTTEEVESGEKPFTLTKRDGVGGLQFTIALYRRGPRPEFSSATLLRMVEDFGEKHGLGAPADQATEDRELSLAAVTYRNEGEFVRVWDVSEGWK